MELPTGKSGMHSHCEHEENNGGYDDEDRISELPDGILAFILSFLGLKEAARTSILSRRWRGQWAFTNRLNLEADDIDIIQFDRETRSRLYAEWVNQVLKSHKSPILEEFRVRFDLVDEWKIYMDEWLMIALARKVQILELDLSFEGSGVQMYGFKYYTFPFDSNNPLKISSLRCLREACFICVHVSGEALEYFLSNCPLLERLTVGNNDVLRNLRVNNPSLVLKYLEIFYCKNIQSFEICNAVNLICFVYRGVLCPNLHLENVPSLVELRISKYNFPDVEEYLFPKLSCCSHQLENLAISVIHMQEFRGFYAPPVFGNLKKLVLTTSCAGEDTCLLGYMSLLDSCPHLQKFMFEVSWTVETMPIDKREVRKVSETKVKKKHQHLDPRWSWQVIMVENVILSLSFTF